MTIQLYVAPAAAGKTAHALNRVLDAAEGLRATPRVVVPTLLQVRSWRRRLAEAGGALGVQLLTFEHLYARCLNAAGESYTELSDPVQYRLIRSVVDGLALAHYAPLVPRPGFIQVLQRLIAELKAARVDPDAFTRAVAGLGGESSLAELAQIYAAYQERLQAQGWADRAGLGWLAVEALELRAPAVARDWPLLVVDGFDSFTSVQLAMLRVLAGRVETMFVTLTGTVDGGPRPFVHDRFRRACAELEKALGVQATPLPEQGTHHHPALAHLEASLFLSSVDQRDAVQVVELVETPDRAAEVRAALRWLKARLVQDGMRPDDLALLARSMSPYRPFLLQIAAEFGLPVRLLGGIPLRSNPAIAALLDLLRLVLPLAPDRPEPALPRRGVVEAWRSPYFDWSTLAGPGASDPVDSGLSVPTGVSPADADALDAAARWGRVIGGLSQWEEALANLASQAAPNGEVPESGLDEEQGWPRGLPRGLEAGSLLDQFRRFVRRLTPPQGENTYRAFVCWLEELIGPDPDLGSPRYPAPEEPTALQIVARARQASPSTADRDVAALRAFKEILRGLVWAEDALGTGEAVGFRRFFEELVGAVEAASYSLPADPERGEILVADVVQARGVPFRAVAVLGLAEGEFPATIAEDPFLRDADRLGLRAEYGFALDPSTESAEAEFFYEAVTRPRERLLLTRPRLADNGALWQASPFWEEVRRLVATRPTALTSESLPLPGQVASWPELLESLATHPGYGQVRHWLQQTEPQRMEALALAAHVLEVRGSGLAAGGHDGDLTGLGDAFGRQFDPRYTWSASRLESYRTCPFFFFVGRVLGLEPREEPAEGLDRRQLGTIYHRILEKVYQAPAVRDPTRLDQLLAALPGVAAAVLDAAPEELGFRETAWWAQTRDEILNHVRRSLEALCDLAADFVPCRHEAAFGLFGQPPLIVRQGDDRFRLRGLIDRVDRAPDGRLRVIDYKSGGPSTYSMRAVAEGKKLQLPLYALAARDALGLGEPAEGFYWHVQHAESSPFRMSRFTGGPQGATDVAVEKAWEAVRGARDGFFVPQRPDTGCPSYCPAAGFCWHYEPGFGG
jgi:ATP-dependent helicase/DNAse subunit B